MKKTKKKEKTSHIRCSLFKIINNNDVLKDVLKKAYEAELTLITLKLIKTSKGYNQSSISKMSKDFKSKISSTAFYVGRQNQ